MNVDLSGAGPEGVRPRSVKEPSMANTQSLLEFVGQGGKGAGERRSDGLAQHTAGRSRRAPGAVQIVVQCSGKVSDNRNR